MSSIKDFDIRDGYLEKYLGHDETVVIPEEVTRVGNWAFSDNLAIKKIVLGESITDIYSTAFNGCSNVVEYEVSERNSTYCSIDGIIFTKDMKKLVEFPGGRGGVYTVPEGVEEIGFGAFYKNAGISEVHLPESLSAIRLCAFSYCDGMKHIHIPANVIELDCAETFGSNMESITVDSGNKKYAGYDGMVFSGKFKTIQYCPPKKKGEVTLPETVSGINACAFRDCSQIAKIEIPKKVTKIGAQAFSGCSGLNEIIIPENVAAISNDTFRGCTGLKEISLPEKITVVPESAFENCSNLMKVILPDNLTAIERKAFDGCDSLKEIVLPPHVSKLGTEAVPSGTVVFCPAEIFKKLPAQTKETTCIKYLEASDRFSEKLSEVITAYIKKNKSDFFETLIKEGNAAVFENCLALFKRTKAITEECLALSARYNKPEMNFVLLESASKKAEPPVIKEAVQENSEAVPEDNGKIILNSKEAKKIFRFTETPDGAIINGYKGNEAKVVIPDQIGDYPVIGIKKEAFDCNSVIEEVVLPDSITKIDSAFWNCPNLKKINLPENLTELGARAFAKCTQLQRTEIPAGLKKIGDAAFSDCPGFADENGFVIVGNILFGYYGTEEKVIVPDGVKIIAAFAFSDREMIREVVFPKSLKKIVYKTFTDCPGIEKVYISKGLSSIHEWAFAECRTQLTIYAPAGSYAEKYAKENNIKFVAE